MRTVLSIKSRDLQAQYLLLNANAKWAIKLYHNKNKLVSALY